MEQKNEKRKPLGVYLNENLVRALKLRALVEGTTMSAIAERAVTRYIAEHLPRVLKEAQDKGIIPTVLKEPIATIARNFSLHSGS